MGAKQHQPVGQWQVGDVRRVTRLELLDQLIFAAALGAGLQQFEQLLGKVEVGIEVGGHG